MLKKIKLRGHRYINEALNFYYKIQHRKTLVNKLKVESKLVKNESLKVLREFEELVDDD